MSEEVTPLGIDDVMDMYKEDVQKGGIRPLNDYERNIYGGTILSATAQLPFFADAYAVLSPFVDATAETAYTDENARVGLSYWFFYVIDLNTRVTWITHEAMHVLNNHFVRGAALGISNDRMNKMGDLEINTTLQTVPSMNLERLLLPELYELPKLKTLEIYSGLVDDTINEKIDSDSPDANDGEPSNDNSDSDGSESSNGGSEESGEGSESGGESSGEGSSGEGSSGSGSGGSSDNSTDSGSGAGSSDGSDNSSSGQSGSGGSSGGSSKNSENGDNGTTQADRLRNDIENRKKSSPPGTRHCDELTQERSQGADSSNIEKSSPVSQNLARNNTKSRMIDHMNSTKTRGTGASNDFLNMMIRLMSPPKIDWRELFRRAVSNAYSATMIGRSQNSYKRVNRRYSQGKIIFPGTVDLIPTTMFAIDTSGSMGKNDYESLLTEIEAILKQSARSRGGVKVFSVDTTVKDIEPVRSVSEIKLHGGGGTDMSVAFAYVNQLKKKEKPNIFVLGTDGYTDWNSVIREVAYANYVSIILVTTRGGYQSVPDKLRKMATVIDVSDDTRAEGNF